MPELRYDPVKDQKIAYSTKRQGRTFHPPKDYCPLCPTKNDKVETEIPEKSFEIVVFENKFPTFTSDPDILGRVKKNFYKTEEARGICEVISYTSDHDLFLEDMPVEKISNLIKVWQDRYYDLGRKDFIKYVFIFENKGKEIGVTLSHPHGQIYAFSYIPPIIKQELKSSKDYYDNKKECLHCAIIREELKEKSRIVARTRDFIAFIPFYARWPYEVHIYPLRHKGDLNELNDKETSSFAGIIKELIGRYNKLFGFRMPYIMVIHQNPTDNKDYGYYHFHIEFYPPYRTKDKLKYLAGCELGAGTFINDTLPEEKAEELRRCSGP